MILLRLISWPYARKHVLRTVLTTAGIVLGVAVFIGMHTANQTVLLGFSETVDRIAGKTQLQVTAGDTGFGEEVLDVVQGASTVRVAVPIIEVVVDSNIKGEGNLLVLGVDMTGDRSLRDYDLEGGGDAAVEDPLIFLAQPDSLILSKEFADRNQLTTGSRLSLGTSEGQKTFTVRGIITTSGLASAYGGSLAIMDIYAAQHMFGRGRTFDRIDIGMHEGATLADCQRELQALIGSGFDVQPPSGRGQQFEAMLASYSLDGRHLERVRPLHRHVHHLQRLLDCRDRAPVGDRDPSGDRRDARTGSMDLPWRKRGHRCHRIAGGARAGHADGAWDRRRHRGTHQRRLSHRTGRGRDRD